ncbi:penicillin acylase family protein [Synoicihabitans lomoniglobus]|uniref:Penicillin acylase family protein n=1 Tax=Synoicihabitans lomoniglobus TaxID=2909285 RepID=A0AAE9ZVB5_9BACT|nr:penicillin acylase family protein [Opitutaceae bacterium LMO-M01]WED63749.1 penicillin acylase family protein [Opitutaceae bacterium LMO-M01]
MKVARIIRWFGLILCALALILVGAFAWMWSQVKSSLPPLDGELPLAGLSAPATLARDAMGTAVIHADNRVDAMRALGFAHGQDRFFQMDLLRRRAAGELSGLFGEVALWSDRTTVVHRFRAKARTALEQESPTNRALIAAYTTGVNAGLASLSAAPWEYAVARTEPQPWAPEDCMLVLYSMVLDLQNSTGSYEQDLTVLRDVMGTRAVDFFNPIVGPDDRAIDGSTAPLPPPPSEEVIDLRGVSSIAEPEDIAARPDRLPIGSNAMALPGDRTTNGAALLAGDPHLGLRVPNIWYRAQLNWTDAAGSPQRITGASMPGTPGIAIGSNGHIAWSFTNAMIDTGDLVAVDLNPVAPEILYLRGTESLEFEEHVDTITLKNGDTETVESTWTVYGPIVGKTLRGKSLAFKWVFHDPAAVNLGMLDLQQARDVEAAVNAAHRAGLPSLNLLVADSAGAAAWTITGRIPQRFGYDGRFPVSWTYGDRGWSGYLDSAETPVIRAAPGQALWDGNNRAIGGDALARLGDSGYDDPERGAQLARGLEALTAAAAPADLAAIQTDPHADWMLRWRDLLLATFERTGASGDRAKFLEIVKTWDGTAGANSVAYRLLRDWRGQVTRLTLDPIFSLCTRVAPDFRYWRFRYEAALWALHRDEPAHLITADYLNWDALRLAAVDRVIAQADETGQPFDRTTWGDTNRLDMNHPFGEMVPEPFAGWLNMPHLRQSGDSRMPFVQRPSHGASLRMAVSPGHEDEGLLHLPGGQSGNPLSVYYRAGHTAWAQNVPVPLLPGEPEHTLTLTP